MIQTANAAMNQRAMRYAKPNDKTPAILAMATHRSYAGHATNETQIRDARHCCHVTPQKPRGPRNRRDPKRVRPPAIRPVPLP